jgi:enterochelin esterase-like enzyme
MSSRYTLSVTAARLRLPGTRAAGGAAVLAAFVAFGLLGARGYLDNYLTYRGFAPPREPSFVTQTGTVHRLLVSSAALGGRSQEAYVYLPPGYAQHPRRRYPVLYLLHGFPGRPLAFLETVQMGIVEDVLAARHRAQPLILVLPFGSTGTFTDQEWANGVSPGNGWATFVARDLVRYVDAHFRTIPRRSGRAIGGLSEGGYGAINIALHHPREFSVVESWSGYQRPDRLRAIFGSRLQLLPANDPRRLLRKVAPELRKLGTYFWFYSGSTDPLRRQNAAFARELGVARLRYRYFQVYGGHTWGIWRDNASAAYTAAAARLGRG